MKNRFLAIIDSRRGAWLLLLVLAIVIQTGVLLWSLHVAGEVGFPADDAWIHQVYARNFAQTGSIAFNPGELTSGDTAPLWMLLLVPGYFFPDAAIVWTMALGVLAYYAMGILVLELAPYLFITSAARRWGLVAAVLTLTEWHLVWIALSGMETTLFIVLTLLVVFLAARSAAWWQLGIAGGLAIATRPEAAVLVGLMILWRWRTRTISAWAGTLLFILGLDGLLLLFNWIVGGSLLPNTFAAKSAGVAQPGAGIDFLIEYGAMLLLGVNVSLLPAIIFGVEATRAEKRPFVIPLLWCGALLLLYVIFFPIIYNHLRYMIPTLPWILLLSVAGLVRMAALTPAVAKLQGAIAAIMVLVMVPFAANVYAFNVQNVNAMQREAGRWLREHTPAHARIAADDIGAIGYFSDRYIIDLAGLVTPEIVPLKRAHQSLSPFLCAAHVDYFAIYPAGNREYDSFFELDLVQVEQVQLNTINPNAVLQLYHVRGCQVTH